MNSFGFIILMLFSIGQLGSQTEDPYIDFISTKSDDFMLLRSMANENKFYSNDTTIDVKSYKLKIKPSINDIWLEGEVCIDLAVQTNQLNRFNLDLAPELEITHFTDPVAEILHEGRQLTIVLNEPFSNGEHISFCLSYSGQPALLNDIKGLNYKIADQNNPIVVSLSTPYLAHQWWPCKDGPEDKADSISVEIIIPEKTLTGKTLKAVSNGILSSVEHISDELVNYKWTHRYPIVPYYIMVAIAPYEVFTQNYYSQDGKKIPLEYFVFADQLQNSKEGVEQIPEVLNLFESLFGPYPFSSEKYGMTQLGFYGGIENQTNSIVNRMTPDYFRVSVHELAHMWFGDMITCKDWHDAWLNEGFASYAECLWEEFSGGIEAYHACLKNKRYLQGGTLYLQLDNDPFGIFKTIIYYKGAWLLHMLRHIVGDSIFFDFIKEYAQHPEWQYGHSSSIDFIDLINSIQEKDLISFMEQWLYYEYYPVFEYNFEQDDSGMTMVHISQVQKETHPTAPFYSIPVDLLIRFTDGSDTLIIAAVENPITTETFQSNKSIESIELDPGNWILCEKYFNPALNISSSKTSSAMIFPNPFRQNDRLTINGKFITAQMVELRNIHGKLLFEFELLPNSNKQLIDMSEYNISPGSYFLVFRDKYQFPVPIKILCLP